MLTTEERALGLGATDIAAIVGVSPYRAAIEVYREKVGLDEPREQTDRMRWGQLLQDAVRQGYEERYGRRLIERKAPLRHKRFDFLYGHPDYYVVGEPGLVEVKTAVTRRGWREDEPPAHVRVQCQWYLGLSGREWCDVALLSATSTLDVFRVEHDPELFEALTDAAAEFWTVNVEGNVEPPPDGTEAYRRHIVAKYPRSEEVELVATPEQALWVEELRDAIGACDQADAHADTLRNRLADAMGPAAVLIAPAGRITYRSQAPATRWKSVAEALANEHMEALEPYIAADKAGREGPRVLRPTFGKE